MELAKGDTMRTTMPRRALRAPLACALALAACGGLGIGATIGGTLTGLASGGTLVLANNGKDNLALTSNGSFTFATQLDTGAAFGVTIVTQPAASQTAAARSAPPATSPRSRSTVAPGRSRAPSPAFPPAPA
jgi:hypothetical protein